MMLYRAGHWLARKNIPLLPTLCDLLIRLLHNCAVYSATEIGKGTQFAYGGIAVVIHKNSRIGDNCMIGSNVTIGGRSKSATVPVIGDNVYIATGAKILGAVTIGNNCVIGANAVVIADVPPDCVVAGIPAKVIKTGIDVKDYF
ncbi:serine O-acetyltransferase [Thalassomonas haliotis]|uniref:Serine acetyltransferase n=1 Tax=Thalassomonas haliotis TaxID=485448 RepID=A0ABY7VGC1_9GAMM|nr:serine O-acetyltransferase [Thalassomonas haliotis]WDE12784.1 serine acetyltransferase [Thalassomonas haliotis]